MTEPPNNHDLPTFSRIKGNSPSQKNDLNINYDKISEGSLIGNFEIISEIGRGGMGIVYQARENSLNRIVALKFLHANVADNPSAAKRFKKEAKIAANLNHPNIVRVFHIEEGETPRYFAMEFIDGRSLKEKVEQDGYLSPEEAIRIIIQVCDALHYAHQKNVIHRDIKPSNILLENHLEKVRITDFGIAQDVTGQLTDMTVTDGAAIGTFGFIPPEQLQREANIRSDIFSLGITFYYILTGEMAYQVESITEHTSAFESQKPLAPSKLNSAVSEELDKIILKMINVNPKQRISCCKEISKALNKLLPENRKNISKIHRIKKPLITCTALLLFFAVLLHLGKLFIANTNSTSSLNIPVAQILFKDDFDNTDTGKYPSENNWLTLTDGSSAYVVSKPGGIYPHGKIVFQNTIDGNSEIQVIDPNGYHRKILCQEQSYCPRISPDKSKIAFYNNTDDINIMNIDGTNRINLTKTPNVSESMPAWSPDGSKIVYVRPNGTWTKLWIMNGNDGADQKILTSGFFNDARPDWSPDDNWIVFSRKMNPKAPIKNGQLFVINVKTKNEYRLTFTSNPEAEEDFSPQWSPDGKKIVFISSRRKNLWRDQIWVGDFIINESGEPCLSNQTNLTHSEYRHVKASWSPDGRDLIYCRALYQTMDTDLWIMKADGSDYPGKQLTNTSEQQEDEPCWCINKVFRLESLYDWSRNDYFLLPHIPDRLTYEVSVLPDPIPGRGALVGFTERFEDQVAFYNRFLIKSDDGVTGSVEFSQGVDGSPIYHMGNYNVGDWVTVRADLDYSRGKGNLWLNGQRVIENAEILNKEFLIPHYGNITLNKWGVSEGNWRGKGTGIICIDNVKLYEFN